MTPDRMHQSRTTALRRYRHRSCSGVDEMKYFKFFLAFAIALIATKGSSGDNSGSIISNSVSNNAGNSGASSTIHSVPSSFSGSGGNFVSIISKPASNNVGNSGASSSIHSVPSSFSGSHDTPSAPYKPSNGQGGGKITSSTSYSNNKAEILIHRPAAIIVKRPPTKVLVNHPPLIVRPAPVVLHKPPAVLIRKVLVKHHPRTVKVEPVYVNVVKPPTEKYLINEKPSPTSYSQSGPSSYSSDSAATANGYQLVQNIASIPELSQPSGNYVAPEQASYGQASSY